MSSIDRFARRLERVERDIRNGAMQPRLPYSSIDGGSLVVKDISGNVQGIIGEQWDGTTTTASVGGAPPVTPTAALVTPKLGGLALYWDGTYVDGSPTRMDFRRVTFHAVTSVDLFDALDPAQICGEITIATGGEVFATLPPVEHFIFVVAWTDAGKFSVESDVALGTPLSLVDDADWQAHETALVDMRTDLDATVVLTDNWRVTGQTTIDGGKIATDSVTSAQIAAGAIIAEKIGANQIVAGKIAVDAVTSGTLAADAITAKHTITGATIQTHPSANTGLKIVGNVLTSYDGAGVARFIANGNDGTVTVVGGSITGGTFKTAATGKRTEINTDSADASRIQFISGQAEESVAAGITATSTRTDTDNMGTGIDINTGTLTGGGSYGFARLLLRGGRGAVPGQSGSEAATKIHLQASGSATIPAELSLGAGAAGLVASDPVGSGNDYVKLTGTEVLLESIAKPVKIYSGGTIAAPGTKISIFETNGDLSIPGRVISALDDTGWHIVGAQGGEPGFTGGWSNFGAGHVPARFKKVNGIVYVQGLVRLGTFGSTAFQLPVGYRPSHIIMNTQIEGTQVAGRMDITDLGQVVPMTGNNSFFSVTFSFPADQ